MRIIAFLSCLCLFAVEAVAEKTSTTLTADTLNTTNLPVQYSAALHVLTLQENPVIAVVKQVASTNSLYELSVSKRSRKDDIIFIAHFCSSKDQTPISCLQVYVITHPVKGSVEVQCSQCPKPNPTPEMKQLMEAMKTALKKKFGDQNVSMTEAVIPLLQHK